ncbi:MAG: hypothetical protein ACRD8W_24685 [Nitrososphaeraceae archaeon]
MTTPWKRLTETLFVEAIGPRENDAAEIRVLEGNRNFWKGFLHGNG